MAFVILPIIAFGVSLLTLFAGFGLGTLLLPAFALFFPLTSAVAATAVVHLLNSLFKVGLLMRHADRGVVLRFGLPAVVAAILGARLLLQLSSGEVLATWQLRSGGPSHQVTPLGLTLGGLILIFAVVDLSSLRQRLAFDRKWLPLGGVLSGFFGGLSGHQGALRAAFLLPLELSPEVFAATQAVLACLVDVTRIAVYGLGALTTTSFLLAADQRTLVAVTAAAAFLGAYIGRRLLTKVTLPGLRRITGSLLLVVGLGLALGLF